MSQQDIDAKIGEAWRAHYSGQDQVAIEKFLQLVTEAPDNIDVYWGLGLSYKDAGDKANAAEAFQKVKSLVTTLLATEAGQLGRYFMLNRMVDQQLQGLSDRSTQ